MKNRLALALAAGAVLLGGPASAGGLYLYEVGSPEVGTAAAGYAARAEDASTVFTNPAGMTRLERPGLLAGVQPMYLSLKFTPDSGTTNTGSGGNGSAWIPAGSLFYVHPLSRDLRLGFGVFGNFGLSLEYEDDWVGRYYVREAVLQGLTFMPAVAYRVGPKLSLGAGLGILYTVFEQRLAINNRPFELLPAAPDGELKLDDEDWGVNGKFGVLYELGKGTRFGATYTTETKIDLSAQTEFSGLGPVLQTLLANRGLLQTTLDLGMTAPQAVLVSAYHEVTDRVALLANVGWEDWSRFGKVDVALVDNTVQSLTFEVPYNDTWHGALGVRYRVSDPWLLSAGVSYDSSMVDDENRGPALPVGETWRFGLGGRYRHSPSVTLGGAYELAWSGSLPMDVNRGAVAGRVSGEYEDTAIHVFNVTLDWTF